MTDVVLYCRILCLCNVCIGIFYVCPIFTLDPDISTQFSCNVYVSVVYVSFDNRNVPHWAKEYMHCLTWKVLPCLHSYVY